MDTASRAAAGRRAWHRRRAGARWLTLLAGAWGGLVLGVSFLATVAKFSTPSLSLPVALDVGRHTFAQLVRVEWVLAAMALALLLWVRPRWPVVLLWSATIALLAVEALWLLPILDRRVSVILAGGANPPARYHEWFVCMEGFRAMALLALGVIPLRC